MGVQGLWTVLQPCARPTQLANLHRKRLAVDASIWIYQFLKAVRDKEGNALQNSHVVGFFRRICKLLWFGIQPVFVFDGGAPALKRATLQGRRRRREGRREDAVRTAGKLLAVQMQRIAEDEQDKRRRRAEARRDEHEEVLPNMDKVVYAEELGMSSRERQHARHFRKQDAYHLPVLDGDMATMGGRPEDPRIMSVEELEEYARQSHAGEDIDLYDFGKIDFDGEFFKSLPPADRYNILSAARLRSRLRMGFSKEQLHDMFPNRMEFSRFQVERAQERNRLTQRLMQELGMSGLDLTMGVNARVAGEKNREYILVKNEDVEGGWALGVVSKEKDIGESHKPIDVDAIDVHYQAADEDEEWEDSVELEDVPIEGLNRLPKPRPLQGGDDEDALFVDNDNKDADEDLDQAIAMSLEHQHGVRLGRAEEQTKSEHVAMPDWEQNAVVVAKPITSASGRMTAHMINNRANAAVPRRRETDASSDSDMDLQTALAAARKKQKAAQAQTAPSPVRPNVQGGSKGPLPFQKIDWRAGLVAEKPPQSRAVQSQSTDTVGQRPGGVETGSMEAESDNEAGGFVKEPAEHGKDGAGMPPEDAARPLPPWLADDTDIRESLRKQQELDNTMNAQDEEEARQEELAICEAAVMEIEASDGGHDSDVEILEQAPSKRSPPFAVSADRCVTDHRGQDATEKKSTSPLGIAKATDDASFKPTTASIASFRKLDVEFEDTVVADKAAKPTHDPCHFEATAAPDEDDVIAAAFDPDAPGPEEFENDWSDDADEDELLAQMAEEVEEHARFASQLNNKPAARNQDEYEQELRGLRNQQKKDRRDADEVTQIMVSECQSLLRLFGIPYMTAPMEAEAQCAELVKLGIVDGVVTDDSDIFLFGGTRVYKNMFNGNKLVECYIASDVERDLSLGREQLIQLAQLLGSDYTEGLVGVGPVTAVEILSEFKPDGREGGDSLTAFRDWWTDVQSQRRPKEADAPSPFRRKFRRSQAAKLFLPPAFPSPAVADAYLHPKVDRLAEPFQWGVADLDGLRRYLMATIGWSQERTDEVLVPVIRDMNKRALEGMQSNITRYFSGAVGAGGAGVEAFAPRERVRGSKRMTEAVGRLRAKTNKRGRDRGLGPDKHADATAVVAPPVPSAQKKAKTR